MLINLLLFILMFISKGVYPMQLSSPAFTDGGLLPSKYTCDGQSISPPIQWQDAPSKTKSFALIYDDPDAPAGTWTHWILLPAETKVGMNSWPEAKYGAPCPPSGEHRYIFHLYALDTMLSLSGTVTSTTLRKAMQGHILATTTLTGRYRRKS